MQNNITCFNKGVPKWLKLKRQNKSKCLNKVLKETIIFDCSSRALIINATSVNEKWTLNLVLIVVSALEPVCILQIRYSSKVTQHVYLD